MQIKSCQCSFKYSHQSYQTHHLFFPVNTFTDPHLLNSSDQSLTDPPPIHTFFRPIADWSSTHSSDQSLTDPPPIHTFFRPIADWSSTHSSDQSRTDPPPIHLTNRWLILHPFIWPIVDWSSTHSSDQSRTDLPSIHSSDKSLTDHPHPPPPRQITSLTDPSTLIIANTLPTNGRLIPHPFTVIDQSLG